LASVVPSRAQELEGATEQEAYWNEASPESEPLVQILVCEKVSQELLKGTLV